LDPFPIPWSRREAHGFCELIEEKTVEAEKVIRSEKVVTL
jgi:hypothetical protein